MPHDTHDYCWNMLPWFVTGRLSANDAQRLERHLEECAACRAELEEQRALCLHIRRDEPLLLAPQSSLQRMMARIDASMPLTDAIDEDAMSIATAQARTRRKPRSYRWLAVAAALQTVAIAALLTLVVRETTDEITAPRFTTLSTPDRSPMDRSPSAAGAGAQERSPDAAKAGGALLRVVFKPETPAARMQTLLHSVKAQVVAGPTEAGVYTLKLVGVGNADAAQKLSQVRADGSVIFAEQIAPERRP